MEIYLSSNKNKIISTVESTKLIESQLEILESKSGVTIDEYGKTILYVDHIKSLYELIETENEWKLVFQKAIEMNSSLIIIGD